MKCEVIRNSISGEAWQLQGDTRRETRLLGIWNWEEASHSMCLGLELSLVHSQEGMEVLQKVPP